jgi:hypothetical protein
MPLAGVVAVLVAYRAVRRAARDVPASARAGLDGPSVLVGKGQRVRLCA